MEIINCANRFSGGLVRGVLVGISLLDGMTDNLEIKRV
jgi:hypothetical protein